MRVWIIAGVLVVALLLVAPVAAQSGDSPITLAVVDGNGDPVTVSRLGCAYSDGPGYPFEAWPGDVGCTDCSVHVCTFDADRLGMGGYVQTQLLNYTQTVPTGAWQVVQGSQTAVLWGDAPWEVTRTITFVLDLAPTPIPTLTPLPTPSQPSSVTLEELSEGFGEGFLDSYGTLSSEGIIPDFGLDHEQWLFAGRKWLQFLNQGNLLYVMGGVLLAILVLRWAIDRLKNPR